MWLDGRERERRSDHHIHSPIAPHFWSCTDVAKADTERRRKELFSEAPISGNVYLFQWCVIIRFCFDKP